MWIVMYLLTPEMVLINRSLWQIVTPPHQILIPPHRILLEISVLRLTLISVSNSEFQTQHEWMNERYGCYFWQISRGCKSCFCHYPDHCHICRHISFAKTISTTLVISIIVTVQLNQTFLNCSWCKTVYTCFQASYFPPSLPVGYMNTNKFIFWNKAIQFKLSTWLESPEHIKRPKTTQIIYLASALYS